MIAGDFRPIGEIKAMIKDLDLLGDLAKATNTPLPLTALAPQLYRLHEGKGHDDRDITSILTLCEATGR